MEVAVIHVKYLESVFWIVGGRNWVKWRMKAGAHVKSHTQGGRSGAADPGRLLRISFSNHGGFRVISGSPGTTRSRNCHGSHVLVCTPLADLSARLGIQGGTTQRLPATPTSNDSRKNAKKRFRDRLPGISATPSHLPTVCEEGLQGPSLCSKEPIFSCGTPRKSRTATIIPRCETRMACAESLPKSSSCSASRAPEFGDRFAEQLMFTFRRERARTLNPSYIW